MNPAAPWPALAFLDALRPEPGWSVDTALIATYSADIVSLVAALLALAGRDDDAGDGNPADLADAVEQLRGKVLFVVQEGRLAVMRKRAAISVILDQFVRSVRCNEQDGSWHPKFAAVRFHTPQGKIWRIWLGSRNLTVASNLDFGLTLDGREGVADGTSIEGVDRAISTLGEKAGLSRAKVRSLASACHSVRWNTPQGLSVLGIRMLSPDEHHATLPDFAGSDELVLISPFLDGAFVAKAAGWAKGARAQRYLVSTLAELRKLAHQDGKPLSDFTDTLLLFESPSREETDPEPAFGDADDANEEPSPDEEAVVRGLHAKICAVRHGTTWQMWVGSANATTRAWGGFNYELVALLEGKAVIGNGLHALLGACKPVSLETLLEAPPAPEDDAATEVESARKKICAQFEGHLAREEGVIELVSDAPFPPTPQHIRVQVGLMTGPLMDCGPVIHRVPLGHFNLPEQTGLVQWRLSAGDIECRWLQCLEVRPALPKDRDHAAIAARMTPSQVVAWIRSLLSGVPDDGGGVGSWKYAGVSAPLTGGMKITLEEVLGSRGRQGSRVADLDARIGTYLKHVMQRCAGQPETLAQLKEFSDLWDLARAELLRP
jgi:hypothetical protein